MKVILRVFVLGLFMMADISAFSNKPRFSATGEIIENLPQKVSAPSKEEVANAMLLGTILVR